MSDTLRSEPPDLKEPPGLPPSSQPSPPSAFLWAGLVCLGLTLLAGLTNRTLGTVMKLVVALLIACGALLFAQSRYTFWRRSAGIVTRDPGERDPLEMPGYRERMARRWDILLFLNLALIAAIPRLVALTHSLWFDELWSIDRFMRNGPLYALTHQEGYNNHLLNSVLGSLCYQAYTAFFPLDNPLAFPPAWVMRLPAFCFGIAAPPLLYATARRSMDAVPAFAAGMLLALSPFAVDYSAQARGYSALLFFAIAQAYYLHQAARSSSANNWVCWLICAVLGTLAHLYFVCILAVDLLFLFALSIWVRAQLMDRLRALALIEQSIALTVAWAALTFVGYIGILPSFGQNAQKFAGQEPMARAHDVIVPLIQLWGGVPQNGALTTFYVVSALLVLAGLWHLARRPSGAACYLMLMLIVPPVLVELARPHFVYMRFFAFLLPAFLTLIACGLAQFARWIVGANPERSNFRALAVGIGAAGFFALTLPGLWEVMQHPKQDYTGALTRLKEEVAQGNAIVGIGIGGRYFRFSDYFSRYFPKQSLPARQQKLEDQLKALDDKKPNRPLTTDQLRDLADTNDGLLVADTGLVDKPRSNLTAVQSWLRTKAGKPVATFVGRHVGWPYRWLDGNSDIQIYRLKSE